MIDVLLVTIDSTGGWRTASEQLAASLTRAGARVEVARTAPPPTVRTYALTDLVQATMARRAAAAAIARTAPRAVIYCSVSAALRWPRPGAIFLDSVAAENRPGRHGIWQRPVERRRLAQAPLLLCWSEHSLDPVRARVRLAPAVVVPPPVDLPVHAEDEGAPGGTHNGGPARDLDVVVYAGDPQKRRLSFLLDVWSAVRREGETLTVAGLDSLAGTSLPPGVRSVGRVSHDSFLALLRRSRVFLAAPRREDHGIAPLEALAAGCMLVTAPAPGPYLALELARQADPRLVTSSADDATALGRALRSALDQPVADYAARVQPKLAAFAQPAVDRVVADDVLPQLLAGWKGASGSIPPAGAAIRP
jgi:glycosyltransferase involved in cell wall biosynthesis